MSKTGWTAELSGVPPGELSAPVTGGIEAAAAAVLGLIAAAAVKKVGVTVWPGLFNAAGTLAIALGVPHVNAGEVSAANAVISILLAPLLREKVTPSAAAKPVPAARLHGLPDLQTTDPRAHPKGPARGSFRVPAGSHLHAAPRVGRFHQRRTDPAFL